MKTPLHVLLVEDSESDAALVVQELQRCGFKLDFVRVDTETAMTAALADPLWQVVITDYSMPRFSGLSAIALVKKSGLDLPVIVVSGAIGEETAVAAMKAGASDYLMKGNLARLGPAIQRELREAEDRRARRQAEEKLRFTQFSVDHASEAIFWIRPDSSISDVNEALCLMLGYTREELQGLKIYEIDSSTSTDTQPGFWRELRERGSMTHESALRAKSGRMVPVEINVNYMVIDGLEFNCAFVRDITERKQLERKLQEAERLKLVGQLVLGVAHEVRNPLNGIMVVTEALYEDLGRNPEYATHVEHIRSQVKRLAELVRDLLDMGKPLDPARLRRDSVKTVCEAAVRLWKTTADDAAGNVELVCEDKGEGTPILADNARLQQVFINLLDNAVQQSPPGAKVRVEIWKPEDGYVSIRVIDHGQGFSPEAEAKLFQPFFTTRKGGTGLGLCIVQRVVNDHGGNISITRNHPLPGCTVEVRLPVAS
jgi:PAS domain S-box-containing protein